MVNGEGLFEPSSAGETAGAKENSPLTPALSREGERG